MRKRPIDGEELAQIKCGRRCEAIISIEPGEEPKVGDRVWFALATGVILPEFVPGGEEVIVTLVKVGTRTRFKKTDMVSVAWEPVRPLR